MRQHIVPRFLLRNFGSDAQDHLFVYDKPSDRVFKAPINNIAAENGFYDFEVNGVKRSLEKPLGTLESEAASVIRSVLAAECVAHISPEARRLVATFAAAQYLRTRRRQKRVIALNHALRDAIIKVGGDPAKATIEVGGDTVKFEVMTPEENRRYCLESLGAQTIEYARHFENKVWVLHKTAAGDPFIIGDSPIGLDNMRNRHSSKSMIGLAVPGIEVYLPLSRTITLGFLWPTIGRLLRTRPLTMTREKTKRLNALQVAYAERFVYAGSREDLDLVREMITMDPAFRTGLRDSSERPREKSDAKMVPPT